MLYKNVQLFVIVFTATMKKELYNFSNNVYHGKGMQLFFNYCDFNYCVAEANENLQSRTSKGKINYGRGFAKYILILIMKHTVFYTTINKYFSTVDLV